MLWVSRHTLLLMIALVLLLLFLTKSQLSNLLRSSSISEVASTRSLTMDKTDQKLGQQFSRLYRWI